MTVGDAIVTLLFFFGGLYGVYVCSDGSGWAVIWALMAGVRVTS